MDKNEIFKILKLVENLPYRFEICENKLHLYGEFSCSEEEEPHDLAWDGLIYAQEQLEPLGLTLVDTWSDNDSYGGYIHVRQS